MSLFEARWRDKVRVLLFEDAGFLLATLCRLWPTHMGVGVGVGVAMDVGMGIGMCMADMQCRSSRHMPSIPELHPEPQHQISLSLSHTLSLTYTTSQTLTLTLTWWAD